MSIIFLLIEEREIVKIISVLFFLMYVKDGWKLMPQSAIRFDTKCIILFGQGNLIFTRMRSNPR